MPHPDHEETRVTPRDEKKEEQEATRMVSQCDATDARTASADVPTAYSVEIERDGCEHCGHDRQWDVVGPDGYALGQTFGSEEEAEDMARLLSAAHEFGVSERLPSALSFDELRAANVLRCESAFHSVDAWTPWEWSNAMAGECGEACNVTKKMNRIWPANQFKQSWNKPEDSRMADLEQKLADELADVVIYADLLAARIGRSLADCVRHKFNEKSDEIGSPVKLAALASASGKAEAK